MLNFEFAGIVITRLFIFNIFSLSLSILLSGLKIRARLFLRKNNLKKKNGQNQTFNEQEAGLKEEQ